MDITNQEKQYEESLSAFFTRTSFRTNQNRQKALCSKSLASLLFSHLHQPEYVLYTTVYSVRCFKEIWKVGKVGKVGKIGKVGKVGEVGKVGREGLFMPTWSQL
jgi:hypothetical protein